MTSAITSNSQANAVQSKDPLFEVELNGRTWKASEVSPTVTTVSRPAIADAAADISENISRPQYISNAGPKLVATACAATMGGAALTFCVAACVATL